MLNPVPVGHESPGLDMGGRAEVIRPMYNFVMPYLTKTQSLLNLGAGVSFIFESICHRNYPNLKITSADQLAPAQVPGFVQEFQVIDITRDFAWAKDRFDTVCLFEVIEHVDHTDLLIKNAMRLCRPGGHLIMSFPNLSSIYGRIELLLGYQPHVLEVSNERANFGTGPFGRANNPTDLPVHHIRGITARAGRQLVAHHGLKVQRFCGASWGILDPLWRYLPGLAPVNLLIGKTQE